MFSLSESSQPLCIRVFVGPHGPHCCDLLRPGVEHRASPMAGISRVTRSGGRRIGKSRNFGRPGWGKRSSLVLATTGKAEQTSQRSTLQLLPLLIQAEQIRPAQLGIRTHSDPGDIRPSAHTDHAHAHPHAHAHALAIAPLPLISAPTETSPPLTSPNSLRLSPRPPRLSHFDTTPSPLRCDTADTAYLPYLPHSDRSLAYTIQVLCPTTSSPLPLPIDH
jgi:hypothetical protein